MGLEIVWSKLAVVGYSKILKYLDEQWTEKEVQNFEEGVASFLKVLSEHPQMLQESTSKGLRRGPINRLTILTYRITKDELQIVNIRSSRQQLV